MCKGAQQSVPEMGFTGAGGSEFGKPRWLAVLKAGFKNAGEPPEFKLWQLALADHVVRICATVFWVLCRR